MWDIFYSKWSPKYAGKVCQFASRTACIPSIEFHLPIPIFLFLPSCLFLFRVSSPILPVEKGKAATVLGGNYKTIARVASRLTYRGLQMGDTEGGFKVKQSVLFSLHLAWKLDFFLFKMGTIISLGKSPGQKSCRISIDGTKHGNLLPRRRTVGFYGVDAYSKSWAISYA